MMCHTMYTPVFQSQVLPYILAGARTTPGAFLESKALPPFHPGMKLLTSQFISFCQIPSNTFQEPPKTPSRIYAASQHHRINVHRTVLAKTAPL